MLKCGGRNERCDQEADGQSHDELYPLAKNLPNMVNP